MSAAKAGGKSISGRPTTGGTHLAWAEGACHGEEAGLGDLVASSQSSAAQRYDNISGLNISFPFFPVSGNICISSSSHLVLNHRQAFYLVLI